MQNNRQLKKKKKQSFFSSFIKKPWKKTIVFSGGSWGVLGRNLMLRTQNFDFFLRQVKL